MSLRRTLRGRRVKWTRRVGSHILVVLRGETRGAPAPRLLLPLPEYLAEVQKVFGPPGPSSSVR
jgi:hypothetical protein